MRFTEINALLDEQVLDEVKMSPSALQKFAKSPEAEGMLIGIEFEMGVPDVEAGDDSDSEWEYDYDMNERARDIDDIIYFFSNGEFSNLSSREADRSRETMYEQFSEWESDKIQDDLDEDDLQGRILDKLEDEVSIDDYEDGARELLGDDAPDDAVQSKAVELRDAAITEMISDADSRLYQSAYDYAREELENEMRGSYDESDWLSDIGIRDMQDAEREWGFDWPHMHDSNEGNDGGGDLDSLVDEFSQAMGGVKVNTSSGYHGATRDGRSWIIEPDGSIDAERGDAGLEFVSPPMPLQQGLESLKQFYAWAKERGCYTNDSTGLHMNISVPDMSTESLDYVKLALFMGDEYLLKQFGRQYNSYCKSAMSKIRDRIRPEDVPTVLNQIKQNLNSLASKIIHSGITEKYTSINTRDKYVEFRGPGGDYLDSDPLDLVNTALRLAMSLRIATNPESYKQEYAKKLYKLVSPNEGDWTDPNNTVALFSRYSLGQINKTELVNNVRQAQAARNEKKGEEQKYWVMNRDGSGGKQMVVATSETDAIIKGGSQLGMKREESISKLKAELFTKDSSKKPMPADLSDDWQSWLKDISSRQSDDNLRRVLDVIPMKGDMTDAHKDYVMQEIAAEIERRSANGTVKTAAPASVPTSWKDWIEDTLPNVTVDTVNSVRQRIVNGGDNLDADANDWIVGQIDNELRSRQDQGVVDGNETRWAVKATTHAYRNWDPVYVDADTPRQAKLKAVEVFSREHGITITADDLEAIATTTSREMFDSLSRVWQGWLQDISNKSDSDLQNIIDKVQQGTNAIVNDLSNTQKDYIANTIKQELQRRSGNAATAQETNRAENAVYQSLPDSHRDFIDYLADKSDMGLINTLANPNATTVLNDQQAAYFRIALKHELRRRGINPDTQEPVDAAVAQQVQLINRDDPVTSNDPEATDGPGMWMIGNHTYGRETFRANNRDAAIQAYAERNGISVEDLTSDRSFVAQLREPIQGELDLREMRKLAGLK